MAVSSRRMTFLPGRKAPAGMGMAMRSRRVVALDKSVQEIDALAIDDDIGSQLAVTNVLRPERIVVQSDGADNVHDQESGVRGNFGQFDRTFEHASLGLRRVKKWQV